MNGVKWKLASTNNPATWHCIKYPFHLTPKSSHSHITRHHTSQQLLFHSLSLSLWFLFRIHYALIWKPFINGVSTAFLVSLFPFRDFIRRVSSQCAFVPFSYSNGVWAPSRRTAQLRHDLRRGLHGAQQELRQRLAGFLSHICSFSSPCLF